MCNAVKYKTVSQVYVQQCALQNVVLVMDEDVLTKMIDASPGQDRVTKTAEEIHAAGKRVGGSAKDQLRWALNFSNKDLSDPSLGTVLDLFLELYAFQILSAVGSPLKLPDSVSLEKEAFALAPNLVRNSHKLFNHVLLSYVRDRRFDIESDDRTMFILTPQGFSFFTEDPVMDCVLKLLQLIAEFPEHVHRCPEGQRGCGKWFLADRKDAVFCSKTCAGRKRVFDFREREIKKKGRKKHAKR